MKQLALTSLLVLVAVCVPVLCADVEDPDVIVLTNDNFEREVMRESLMLVEFYAPWCGHCKNLAPEYAEAATALLKNDPPIKLGKVDATVHSELAGKYEVRGYPTLFVFRNGRQSPYNGPRKAAGIVSYMKKLVGPAAKPLATVQEVENFKKSDPESGYAVVGFFESSSSQLHSSFLLLTNRLREDYVFGKVTDPAVAAHFGVKGDAIVAFKDFDDGKAIYDGPTKTKDVEQWIKANSVPLVGEFTPEKADSYFKKGLPIGKFYLRVDKSNTKQHNYFFNRLKKVAQEFQDRLLMTFVDKTSNAHEMEALGRKDDETAFVIEKEGKKYVSDLSFSLDNLRKFVTDFLANKVPVHVKSERAPKNNNGPVKIVTGQNFNELVQDSGKDVLIEFYAPWCGHCKALEPKYNQLGEKLKGTEVVVGKLDATANDYPTDQFKVSGYPTIYFKGANKKTPVLYEGAREVDAMYSWLKKQSKSLRKKSKKKSRSSRSAGSYAA